MAKTKKKKSNPGIAVKKKRKTKIQIRRSAAAKKGWQTRRLNTIAGTKPKKKRLSYKELEAELRRATKIKEEGWVHAAEPDMIRKDGSLALHSSRLRHTAVGTELRKEMVKLERKGQSSLRDYIRFWAAELDIPVQEFYTLLMSP